MMRVQDVVPPCAARPDAYLDERLHNLPVLTELSIAERERLSGLLMSVRRDCASCPILIECLYESVVEVDVFGYAACTTGGDRRRIREMLGIAVTEPVERFDRVGAGRVDHENVLALRRRHPSDTFAQLAARLGCSLSTVKRHLRRGRDVEVPRSKQKRPTVDEVLDCFDQLEAITAA